MIVSAPLLQHLDFFLQPPPKFSFTLRNFLYETHRNFLYETPSRWLLNWPAPSVNGCWFHARMNRNARNLKWLSRVHKSGRDWRLYRIWRQFLTHGNESALSIFKTSRKQTVKNWSKHNELKDGLFSTKMCFVWLRPYMYFKVCSSPLRNQLASRQNTQ